MIKALAHICFVVRDLNASIAFYRDALGLKPAFDFINDKSERFGVYLHVGDRSFIELFQGNSAAPASDQSYKHFCLEVDDVEKTVAGLVARGVQVTPTKMGSDNSWQAWLADPDGNKIELHGYTPQSKQAPWVK
jgi:lactoylglutathione lyase/glyoxylase I family protein